MAMVALRLLVVDRRTATTPGPPRFPVSGLRSPGVPRRRDWSLGRPSPSDAFRPFFFLPRNSTGKSLGPPSPVPCRLAVWGWNQSGPIERAIASGTAQSASAAVGPLAMLSNSSKCAEETIRGSAWTGDLRASHGTGQVTQRLDPAVASPIFVA